MDHINSLKDLMSVLSDAAKDAEDFFSHKIDETSYKNRIAEKMEMLTMTFLIFRGDAEKFADCGCKRLDKRCPNCGCPHLSCKTY